jgi:hypothetical protein
MSLDPEFDANMVCLCRKDTLHEFCQEKYDLLMASVGDVSCNELAMMRYVRKDGRRQIEEDEKDDSDFVCSIDKDDSLHGETCETNEGLSGDESLDTGVSGSDFTFVKLSECESDVARSGKGDGLVENSYRAARLGDHPIAWRFVFHPFHSDHLESNGVRICCPRAAQQAIRIRVVEVVEKLEH